MLKKNALKTIDSAIFNNLNVGLYRNTPGPNGKFIEVNDTLVKMFGYANKTEFLTTVRPSDTYFHPKQRKAFSDQLLRRGFVKRKELVLKRKDGTMAYANVTATAVRDKNGKIRWFDGIIEDITKIKAEQQRFQLIFEHSPIAIWEEDFSQCAKLLEKLKKQGVKDFRKYLTANPKVVVDTFRNIKIIDVNKAGLALYGAKSKKELISNLGRTFAKGAIRILIDEFVALASGKKYFEAEFKSRTLSGKLYDVLLRVSVPDGYEKTFKRVIVTLQNISEQKRLEKHLKKMAQQDSLTKLLNSRSMIRRLEEELIRAKRYNLNLSYMMVDVDYFKVINDKFGHQRGDSILKQVADIIKNGLRCTDIVGRYGGDEFCVILTETNADNAKIAAERIRKIISDLKFTVKGKGIVKLSISVGISGFPSTAVKDFRDLISQADKALYLAKASGRNCIVVTPQEIKPVTP